MKTITASVIALAILLSGCLVKPDLQTGENCWRYRVAEDNTGRLTDMEIADIPIVKLNYEDLVVACNLKPEPVSWSNRGFAASACFKDDTIYMLKGFAGKMELYQEQCHALLGTKHNSCVGYGIGSDESACNWNDL